MGVLDSIDSGKRVETTAEEGPAGRQAWSSTVSERLFLNKHYECKFLYFSYSAIYFRNIMDFKLGKLILVYLFI